MSAEAKHLAAALRACRDYEHWAREIVRLTDAIRECLCPYESESEQDTHKPPTPSCFRDASEDRPSGYDEWGDFVSGPRPTLNEIAERVADCPECSRLVGLIRERRQARRKFGAAKRAVRRVGRAAGAEPAARCCECCAIYVNLVY